MTATANIIEKLNEVFADLDAKVKEDNREWGIRRRNNIKKVREELSGERRKMGEWEYYSKLFAAAGGKTWFKLFDGNNEAGVIAVMDKHTENTKNKRNATIAAKLEKAGITEVFESTFNWSSDGFNGVFSVMTDGGKKVVTIDTIAAGGYNIQCYHLRVLVKVK